MKYALYPHIHAIVKKRFPPPLKHRENKPLIVTLIYISKYETDLQLRETDACHVYN